VSLERRWIIQALTFCIVLMAGTYLVGLGAMAFLAPARAASFLLGFATSARAHFIELALRGLVGGALVWHASQMRFGSAFALAGWLLVITTAGLLVVPWRWHRSFAQRAVPHVTGHLRLLGLASLLMGGLVLFALRDGTG
jgi:uncharacterized protein YjeT (DUF2065 family)